MGIEVGDIIPWNDVSDHIWEGLGLVTNKCLSEIYRKYCSEEGTKLCSDMGHVTRVKSVDDGDNWTITLKVDRDDFLDAIYKTLAGLDNEEVTEIYNMVCLDRVKYIGNDGHQDGEWEIIETDVWEK